MEDAVRPSSQVNKKKKNEGKEEEEKLVMRLSDSKLSGHLHCMAPAYMSIKS